MMNYYSKAKNLFKEFAEYVFYNFLYNIEINISETIKEIQKFLVYFEFPYIIIPDLSNVSKLSIDFIVDYRKLNFPYIFTNNNKNPKKLFK
jgi:hypothetical protein